MLYITDLTAAERRDLRRMVRRARPDIARSARMILSSGDGLGVPAIAAALGCCRRAVRGRIHAWWAERLASLRPLPSPAPPADSAIAPSNPAPAAPSGRWVPVVRVSVPEIRRLIGYVTPVVDPHIAHHLAWSAYRRYKQAWARDSHYRHRGAEPPTFTYLRL